MAEIASAFVTLAPSARGFGGKLDSEISGDVNGVGKRLGSSFGKLFAAGAAVIAAAGIGSFLKGSIDEAREAQKTGAATEAILKATGGAAKVSAAQIDGLASSLSAKTAVDDEQIAAGANLLLTFKNVKREGRGLSDIFGRATAAGLDLAAAGFGSVEGNAKQLGKALNDPLKGITALGRAGVTFTDAQKKQIEGFVESNDLLSAQKIILGEVEAQVGGTAAATATSGEKAAVAFGNIKEQVGTALLPVIDGFFNLFLSQVPRITGLIGGIGPAFSKVQAFIAPAVAAISNAVGGQAGLAGAFQSVAGFVMTSIVPAFQNLVTVAGPLVAQVAAVFTGQLLPALLSVGTFLTGTLGPAFTAVTGFLAAHGTAVRAVAVAIVAGVAAFKIYQTALVVVGAVTRAYAAVQAVLNAVMAANPIGIVIIALIALAAGLTYAYKNSETFRKIVNSAFAGVRGVVTGVVNFLAKTVPQKFLQISAGIRAQVAIAKSVATAAFNGIRSALQSVGAFVAGAVSFFATFATGVGNKVQDVVRFFKELPGKITGALASLPGQLISIGANIVGGLTQGIRNAAASVMSAVDAIIGKIPLFIRKKMGIASPSKVTTILGGYIGDGLAKGLLKSEKKVTKAMGKVLDKAKAKLESRIEEFKALVGSVASNLTGDLFGATATEASTSDEGVVTPARTVGQNFLANLTATRGNFAQAIADFNVLKGFGLPSAFVSQLFASGGFPLIHELATDQGMATTAASLFSDISTFSSQLGNAVAVNSDIGGGMTLADLNATMTETNRLLSKVPDDVAKGVNGAAAKGSRNKKKNNKGKKG